MFEFLKRRRTEERSTNDSLQLLLEQEGASSSGMNVNSKTAQTLPAVYCAVSTIAEAVAAMPVHVYNKAEDGERARATGHQAERLLNVAPNDYMTPYDFKLALMRSVLLRGNGYAHIHFDGAGRATSLHLLHPDAVTCKQLANGRLGYQITQKNGKHKNLLQDEVLHVRYHSDDGIEGKSPIQVCRDTIGLGLAQDLHGANSFKNGAKPAGAILFDKPMQSKSMQNIRDGLTHTHTGAAKSGQVMILEGGAKWQPIGLSNSEAEWLRAREFTISDIARMFKISPIFLQDYTHSTYSNFSEASRAFLSQSLRPWLTNLEQALASRLISSRSRSNTFIEFQTADTLRATTRERYEVYDIAIRNGLLNPDECRKFENLPKREGGSEYSQSWKQDNQSPNEAGSAARS